MIVSEVFFKSALINSLIFFWVACSALSGRILLGQNTKWNLSALFAIVLSPAFLLLNFFWRFLGNKKKIRKKKLRANLISLLAIAFATALTSSAFYLIFVLAKDEKTFSSESYLLKIAFFVVIIAALCGWIVAIFVKRVAFFESCWVTFLISASTLLLTDWVNTIFSFGTSATYFSTLLVSFTFLFLVFFNLGGALGYLYFGEGRFSPLFSFERFIGLRFLMTKSSSQVVSLISVISILAVTMACAGMIVVMSVMNGFSSDLRSKILGANAHLMVLKYGNDFKNYLEVFEKTKDIDGIKGASPFILNEGMVSSKRNLSGALISGVDTKNSKGFGQLLSYISADSLKYLENPDTIPMSFRDKNVLHANPTGAEKPEKNNLPGVILGKEMANELQVFVGDVVNLISPVGEIGPTGPIPKAKAFRVAGFFYSGMYEYDAKFAYILLHEAQGFFNLENLVTGIEYRVFDIESTKRIAREIDEAVGGYPFYTRDWMQMNRPMFSALQLEKIAMLIILGTLIFMASLLILVTLIMVVMEKGKEIAILKSMGASDPSIMKIFVTYGVVVGSAGAFLGGALGVALCFLVRKVGIQLDPDVYYFSSLPVKIVAEEVFLVVGAAIIISFLATIPPALFASRLRPVEGLRYE